MDVHWLSASNVDCVTTNPDSLPGLMLVSLMTVSGDRSVYALQQSVSFEFVKGETTFSVYRDIMTSSSVHTF